MRPKLIFFSREIELPSLGISKWLLHCWHNHVQKRVLCTRWPIQGNKLAILCQQCSSGCHYCYSICESSDRQFHPHLQGHSVAKDTYIYRKNRCIINFFYEIISCLSQNSKMPIMVLNFRIFICNDGLHFQKVEFWM